MASVESAVRIPTPPLDPRPNTMSKRKRSVSRSPSPRRRPMLHDVDPKRAAERERQLEERLHREPQRDVDKPLTEAEKQQKAKDEYNRLLSARSGGTYIPPAKLRALQSQMEQSSQSKEWQRMMWDALKKSIHGLINKVNIGNIKSIVPELFAENLVRGRGLFCRSIMKAQAASLPFTPIFAAMAAIVNTKLPQVGELLVKRLVVSFRKSFRRNDKAVCLATTTFIAQLTNQSVVHELLAAQMLQLLLSNPTDDSVEIAVGLMREVGQHLEEMNGPIAMLVYDQLRSILHENMDLDKRTQYMIEVLFQVRKDRYKDNPAIKEELDLIEEEDQITHRPPNLDDDIDVEDGLNVFKFDPEYDEHDAAYKTLKAEILGEGDDSEGGSDDDSDTSSDNEEAQKEREMEIKDQTATDLTNLRRTLYLTLQSSADFEEACHKLMKVNLPVGKEAELPSMVIEACSQRPTYEKFYGLIAERFARLNRMWLNLLEEQFQEKYDTIHRFETNRLRNVARVFGHLLSTDAIGWHVLSVVHLNEEETTGASRIFIKILFQDISEAMGMKKLQERLKDPLYQQSFEGLFPKDIPRNTRFSINYFTSIGMGAVTEDMREYLKNMPKPALPTLPAAKEPVSDSGSDSDSASSYSSYSSRSRSRSRSDSRSRSRSQSNSRAADRQRGSAGGRGRSNGRGGSYGRGGHGGRGRGRSYTPSNSRSRSSSSTRSHSRSEPREQRRGNRDHRGRSNHTPSPSRSRSRSSQRGRGGGGRNRRQNTSSPSASPEPRGRRRRGSSHSDSSLSSSPSSSSSSSTSSSRSRSRSGPSHRHGDDDRERGRGRGGRGGGRHGGGGRGGGGRGRGGRGRSSSTSSSSKSESPPGRRGRGRR